MKSYSAADRAALMGDLAELDVALEFDASMAESKRVADIARRAMDKARVSAKQAEQSKKAA